MVRTSGLIVGALALALVLTGCSAAGTPGPQGSQGPAGAQGPTGERGAAGPEGPAGQQGTAGAQGATGAQGSTGAQGATGSQGPAGDRGATGPVGRAGSAGPRGATGIAGSTGLTGSQGTTGLAGPAGPAGPQGVAGPVGAAGPAGAAGATGPQGPAGSGESALFFALMPPDNAATVAPGADVSFPEDGPNTAVADIVRTGSSTFELAEIGTYRVSVQVPVTEAGQLILTLNGADLAYTVAGRATGTSQITITTLVETTSINGVLTVQNPAGNPTALTITPLGGGTRPVSATLLIELVKAG